MINGAHEQRNDLMPRCREAVQMIRTAPLFGGGGDDRAAGGPQRSAWFGDPTECARALVEKTGGTHRSGVAFGGAWPWVDVGIGLLCPGLPALVEASVEASGPGGVYRRQGEIVFREAAGREGILLQTREEVPPVGRGFDVLWFDETARFLVRDGMLEIEDLFSRTVTPYDGATIESFLLRQRRCDPAVLDHIPIGERLNRPVMMEVARPVAVTASSWSDPEAFFRTGVGFDTVQIRAGRLSAEGPERPTLEVSLETSATGWRVRSPGKQTWFDELAVHRHGDDIVLQATLSAAIDPLATGMRERLAFDLRSFLIAVEPANPQEYRFD